MYTRQVVLAGNGHGGYVALKSLQDKFSSINLMSDDEKLICELRPSDIQIKDFYKLEGAVVVCASYMKLIPISILNKNIIINTHPSLLPKYRGIHSLPWAMLNREEKVGFTIHLMNQYIDDGDILSQFEVSVGKKNSKEIMDIFDDYVFGSLGNVVKSYLDGRITPIKQDEAKASWCCRRNLEDCFIDFESKYEDIEALIRVLVPPYPYPIINTKHGKFYIIESEVILDKTKMHCGRVVNIKDSKVYLKAKDSILIVDKLQKIETDEFVLACDLLKIGERLQ